MGAAGPQGEGLAGPRRAVGPAPTGLFTPRGHGTRRWVSGGPRTLVLPPILLPDLGPGLGLHKGHPPCARLGGAQAGKELGMQATAGARGGTDQLRGWGPGRWRQEPEEPQNQSTRSEAADYTGWRWGEPGAAGVLGAARPQEPRWTQPPGQARSPRGPAPGRGVGALREEWAGGLLRVGSPASKRLNLVHCARAGRQERTRGRRTPAQAAAAGQSATLSAEAKEAFWAEREETWLSRCFFQCRKESCAAGVEGQKRAAGRQESLGALRAHAYNHRLPRPALL